MLRRLACTALIMSSLVCTTGCKCWQGFFKGDLCAPCDPYGGGTFYCGDGCGEKYMGDWKSHPPADCEPCDRYGNYVGHGNPEVVHQLPRATGGMVPASYSEGVSSSGGGCSCGGH